ncbi:cytochrome P450 [Streptomyces bambusae]|uniref:cytochrome P450 n=1 Tax=Streptomyces bambusae TaxID=1550616 RepID=UPI001CFD2492|nr:cytochrome P450 [Streptomyces bambusae]MCB5168319.1 cytochrome P450 [Streptomyces bambusae]
MPTPTADDRHDTTAHAPGTLDSAPPACGAHDPGADAPATYDPAVHGGGADDSGAHGGGADGLATHVPGAHDCGAVDLATYDPVADGGGAYIPTSQGPAERDGDRDRDRSERAGSRCPVAHLPLVDGAALRDLTVLRALQEDGGMHHVALGGEETGWLVTGYDAAAKAMVDPRLRGEHPNTPALRTASLGELTDDELMDEEQLFFLPADEHARLRRTIARPLTHRRVAALTDSIQDVADALLDPLPTGTPVDLEAAFTRPYPVAALCELLGVPADGRRRIHDYAFHWASGGTAGQSTADDPGTSLARYLADLIEQRRTHPGDDLISAMIGTEDPDARESSVLSAIRLLLVAGYRPVTGLLTDGLALLLSERAHWEALRTRPDLLDPTVEELLRHITPASLASRYAGEPTETDGAPLPVGSGVYSALLAVNHDPARFPDPDRFDPDRPANQHFAFGAGHRHCLGAALAKAEVRIALTTLLRRFPRIRLAHPDETRPDARRPDLTHAEATPLGAVRPAGSAPADPAGLLVVLDAPEAEPPAQ